MRQSEKTLVTAAGRVEAYGSKIIHEIRVEHDQEEVKEGIEKIINNLIINF